MERIDTIGTTPDGALDGAFAAWAREPGLAGAFSAPGAAYLVLDGEGRRLLHASADARNLAGAVADASMILPRIAGQIPKTGFAGTAPRLVRMNLDPRRIAPPTLCLLAGGRSSDGSSILLLLPTGAVPVPRRRGLAGSGAAPAPAANADPSPERAEGAPSEADATAPVEPNAGDRFLWRSDMADVVVEISGTVRRALGPLVGRNWDALAQEGRLSGGEAFVSALSQRRTLRAVPVILSGSEAAGRFAVDMSGAPLARNGQPFSGYGGFGLIRAIEASASPEGATPADTEIPVEGALQPEAEERAAAADDPRLSAPAEPAVPAADAPTAKASPDVVVHPPIRSPRFVPLAVAAARFGQTWTGAGTASVPLPGGHPAPTEPTAGTPAPEIRDEPVAAGAASDSDLSVTEHAAFREIARALGARYAGDDRPEDEPTDPAVLRNAGAAVMPFPGTRSSASDAGFDPAALLDGLPAAILIHRGDSILAANRRLLDLTGLADLPALAAAGLDRLFRGLPPGRRSEPEGDATAAAWPAVIEAADGRSRAVEVQRGRLPWQGAPASCLILREAREDDPARELAAERVARSFRDADVTEARAALDALEDGVVTIDGDGRVMSLNRGAASLFACDPREVVGSGFVGLFDSGSAEVVRAGLHGPAPGPEEVSVHGKGFALRIARIDAEDRRVAVLRASNSVRPASAGPDQAAFLTRLAHEISAPITGILGSTDAMLAERFGPLGDARYRGCLQEIKTSGGHVLGRVADLLDLATIEAGGLEMAMKPVALNDLVSGCVERLQPQAASAHIVLRTSFAPDLAVLEADESSLSRAATTVIANAIRFSGAGGQVIVSTMPADRGAVALRVRDTGAGMSAEDMADALEPFRDREQSASRPTGDGSLGLPLTRALIEANRGRMTVSSRKGEGTLVEILLPGRQAMGS